MTNPVAVVTGAGSGIGRVVSQALLGAGYRVALAGRRADALAQTAGDAPGALAVPTDVSDPDSVAALFGRVRSEWGRVDLLFNNAGSFGPRGSVDQVSAEDWQATVGVKGWSIDASNGNLSITMFPLEVLEAFRADPLRLSAGVVFVPGPSTSAGGVLASLDGVKFDNSLGLVLQGEWLSVFKNGRGQISCGPRFVLQKFQIAHGGAVLRANALGFVTSVAFR